MSSALHKNMASVRWLEPHFRQSGIHSTLLIFIDNAGAAIVSGVTGECVIHFPAKITGWTLLADAAGSAVIDIWKTDYTTYPPTVADTIIGAGGTKPTLASAIKNRGSTLNNRDSANLGDLYAWDINVNPGDTFRFNVDSAATVKRLHLALALHKLPKT